MRLRPDLRQAGDPHVVEFRKSGTRGNKLLDHVIGWSAGGWRSMPSSKIPLNLQQQMATVLAQLLAAEPESEAEQAEVKAMLQASPAAAAAVAGLRFPSFISVERLAAFCPELHRRHPAAAGR